MDAVVLAGGKITETEGEFRERTGVECKSLVPLAGRTLVGHVVQALRAAEQVDRIAVVGPPELADHPDCADADLVLPEGAGRSENLFLGIEALQPTPGVLMTTSDIPLATGAMYDDLLDHLGDDVDVGYACVAHETVLAKFADRPPPPPDDKGRQMPNWVTLRLREGAFTGAPCLVLRERGRAAFEPFIKGIFDDREMGHVFGLLRPLFGLPFLVRAGLAIPCPALGWLVSVRDIERRLSKALGVACRSYRSPAAELAFDIDHLTDLELAERVLRQRAAV